VTSLDLTNAFGDGYGRRVDVTTYRCPRADLGCAAELSTTGELDYHLHVTHGYRRTWRLVTSLTPERRLNRGSQAGRRTPDGLDDDPGGPTTPARPSAAAAAARARHRDRPQEAQGAAARARHRGDRTQAHTPQQERDTTIESARAKHRDGAGGGRAGRGKHALDAGRRL
jgi:hypothetical protein